MFEGAPSAEVAHASNKHQRARGELDLVITRSQHGFVAQRAYQSGCAKVRLPRTHGGHGLEAVVLNTAGGLTGGDVFQQSVRLSQGAKATITTQAYEKVYRSSGGTATLETAITLEDDANLHWLPQPTLVYEAGHLHRVTRISAPKSAQFVAVEGLILGRHAMGETLAEAWLRDEWRIMIDDELVFSDCLRLNPPNQDALHHPAGLGGYRALATVVVKAFNEASLIEDLRDDLLRNGVQTAGVAGGVSQRGPLLIIRLLANDGRLLSSQLMNLIAHLRSAPLPRVWSL